MRHVLIIGRKEFLEFVRDRKLVIPFFLLPIGLPVFFSYVLYGSPFRAVQDARSQIALKAVSAMYPWFLLLLAICSAAFSLGMAVESFVGEKERKTLEPLLAAPISDMELFVGKCLSATALPILMAYLSQILFLALTARQMGQAGIPLPVTHGQAVFLAGIVPLVVLLMCAGAAVVSAWASSVQSAGQISGFLVFGLVMLAQWRCGTILKSGVAMALSAACLLGVDALALWLGCTLFRRDRLVV